MPLHNLLFERFLSKYFSRHGNILTARGTSDIGLNLFKQFCLNLDELTLNELFDHARKLGVTLQPAIMNVANAAMIWVSKNLFV